MALQDGEAVPLRQVDVEDHQIVRGVEGEPLSFRAVERGRDLRSLPFQAHGNGKGDVGASSIRRMRIAFPGDRIVTVILPYTDQKQMRTIKLSPGERLRGGVDMNAHRLFLAGLALACVLLLPVSTTAQAGCGTACDLDESATAIADKDFVADAPTDPSKWRDPQALVWAYAPIEEPAIYASLFKDFTTHLGACLGRQIVYYPVQSSKARSKPCAPGGSTSPAFRPDRRSRRSIAPAPFPLPQKASAMWCAATI